MKKEQILQENAYIFPYHYLMNICNNEIEIGKTMMWGFEYLSYLSFVKKNVLKYYKKGKLILDVGCGDGKLINLLNREILSESISGVDYSEKSLKFAKIFNPGITFYYGDINNSTLFNNIKYDIIILMEVLEHIPLNEISGFIQSISTHLKKNGIVIITVPSDKLQLNKKHFQHFNKVKLSNYLSDYFDIIEFEFLNSNSKLSQIHNKFFFNKYFVLNHKKLLRKLWELYIRFFFYCNEKNAGRLFAVAVKK